MIKTFFVKLETTRKRFLPLKKKKEEEMECTVSGDISKNILVAKTLKFTTPKSEADYVICEQKHHLRQKTLYNNKLIFKEVLDLDSGGTYPLMALLHSFPDQADEEKNKVQYLLEVASKPLSEDPQRKYSDAMLKIDETLLKKSIIIKQPVVYIRVIVRGKLVTNRIIRCALGYTISLSRSKDSWGTVTKRQASVAAKYASTKITNFIR